MRQTILHPSLLLSAAAAVLFLSSATAFAQTVKHKVPAKQTGLTPEPLPPTPKEYPLGAVWILKSFLNKPVPVNDDITFSISATYRGSGFSGCNTWSATIYPVKSQRLLSGPIATTKKTCDKAVTAFETAFLAVLRQGPTWDLVNSDLTMTLPAGKLLFQRSF